LARRRHSRHYIGAVAAAGFSVLSTATAAAGSLVAGEATALDRIAFAVDGAESSHGADPKMWRAEPEGPQGPMQVSAAAATDVGGGDRFDPFENRALGRAYLAHLFRRYANWPDAVAAYNWGPGHMDAWIGAGRPRDKFPLVVWLYRLRVLFGRSPLAGLGASVPHFGIVHPSPPRSIADLRHPSRESVAVERLYGAIMSQSNRSPDN
jgi:Transglycosylase SLT domain